MPTFNRVEAILWGGLVAGCLDLGAVFTYWATQGTTPIGILQAIAMSLMGPAAFQGGYLAALLGLVLHFGVSFAFAGVYVVAAMRFPVLKSRPFIFGLIYGLIAYLVMSKVVVPLSRADYGTGTPLQISISLFIHLVLFGLPIALAASRMRSDRQAAAAR